MIALITVAATMSSKMLGLNGETADEDGFSLNGGNGGGHTRRRVNFFSIKYNIFEHKCNPKFE